MASCRDRRTPAERLLHAPRPGKSLAQFVSRKKLRENEWIFVFQALIRPISLNYSSGFEQSPWRLEVLRSDALRAPDLEALPSQILRTLWVSLSPIRLFRTQKLVLYWIETPSFTVVWLVRCVAYTQTCVHSMNWGSWRCSSRKRLAVAAPLSISTSLCSTRVTFCPDCKWYLRSYASLYLRLI